MQERLGRTIRYGVIAAIGAATLGAVLFFSGCSQNNPANAKRDNVATKQETGYSAPKSDYKPSNSNIEVLLDSGKASSLFNNNEENSKFISRTNEETGPELFDPRDNMGLKNLEQKVEVQEPARKYQPPAELVTLPPIRTPVQNPTVPTPLPTTPVYQVPQEPVAQPSQLPNYQTQPLQQIQTQRANDYQQPAPLPTTSNYQTQPLQQIQPRDSIPRTNNNWNPNPSRGFQRQESESRY